MDTALSSNGSAGNNHFRLSGGNRRFAGSDTFRSVRSLCSLVIGTRCGFRAEGTVSDPGSSVAAGCIHGTAGDLHLCYTLVTAADPGAALIGFSVCVYTCGNITAGDLDIRITVHSAADPGAHVVGCICSDFSAVDGHVRIVISGTFICAFAAAKTGADAGISLSINDAAVDDDFTAGGVIAAADPGAVTISFGSNVTAVDGNGSPLIFCVLIGAVRGPIHWIIRAADAGRSACTRSVDRAAVDGDITVNPGFALAAADAGSAAPRTAGGVQCAVAVNGQGGIFCPALPFHFNSGMIFAAGNGVCAG